MIFLDTNIIIYLSKELISLDDIFEDDEKYAISVITYMEVLGYKFQSNQEEYFVRKLLSYFDIVYLDKIIADKVIEIRQKNKIKLPDAIICATCIVNNAQLFTNDLRLQNIKDLKIKLRNL